jgi:hypothetical protein
MRVSIALDHLRRNRGSFQSQPRADLLFEFRREMREDANCARELAHTHVFRSGHEPRNVALRLGIPVGDLEAECDGLSVNAVSAPDHGSVLKLPRASLQNFGEALQILRNDLRRLPREQRLGGVDDIVGSKAVVEPARMRPDDFRDSGSEGDDVVAYFGFDLVDAFDAKVSALADGASRVLGDESRFGQRLSGGDFDGQPGAEAVFVAPDAGHFRAGVALDHGSPVVPLKLRD